MHIQFLIVSSRKQRINIVEVLLWSRILSQTAAKKSWEVSKFKSKSQSGEKITSTFSWMILSHHQVNEMLTFPYYIWLPLSFIVSDLNLIKYSETLPVVLYPVLSYFPFTASTQASAPPQFLSWNASSQPP